LLDPASDLMTHDLPGHSVAQAGMEIAHVRAAQAARLDTHDDPVLFAKRIRHFTYPDILGPFKYCSFHPYLHPSLVLSTRCFFSPVSRQNDHLIVRCLPRGIVFHGRILVLLKTNNGPMSSKISFSAKINEITKGFVPSANRIA
jgi:hypothetical protein